MGKMPTLRKITLRYVSTVELRNVFKNERKEETNDDDAKDGELISEETEGLNTVLVLSVQPSKKSVIPLIFVQFY